MPGKVIGINMPLGYPGDVTRSVDSIIDSRPVKEGSAPIMFGAPVALNSDGTVEAFGASHTDADFMGIAIRHVKTPNSYFEQNNTSMYNPKEMADVLVRGSIVVGVQKGVPVAGGKAYIRTLPDTANAALKVGGIEAEAATVTVEGESKPANIALDNATWYGPRVVDGVSELVITRRNI